MTGAVRVSKRILDIVSSTIGLGLTMPLYPLIAAAIYIDSPGPLLYRQKRAGQLLPSSPEAGFRFTEFDMFKFRTMRPDAEKTTGAVLAEAGDPRVTRVGQLLRRTRLDEVPQLWNVLRGEMSLVGPRPERPELIGNLALAIPFFEERMRDVKPGVTGLAQVSLGYTGAMLEKGEMTPFREALTNPFKLDGTEGALADDMRLKMLYDFAYSASLERFSTFARMELSVILRTPWVMLRGLGR